MVTSDPDGDVLVAVKKAEHVEQLVRTAGDLARAGNHTVRLVTVVVKPYESPFGVFDDETIRRDFSGDSQELLDRAEVPDGITVERDIVVARSVSRGLLAAVENTDPQALVVGWRGAADRGDALLGSTIDTLVERVPCDLYVERVGREADGVESVLLPVAGGPHVEPAAAAASAIAAYNDARVVVLSVATPDDDLSEERASEFAAAAERSIGTAPGPDPPVDTEVTHSADVATAIADAAADHDVVVVGATRQGALRTRLIGSVPRRVVDLTDRTVVLARSGATVDSLISRVGGLLRRW